MPSYPLGFLGMVDDIASIREAGHIVNQFNAFLNVTRLRFEVFSLEQALDTFSKKLAQLLNQA